MPNAPSGNRKTKHLDNQVFPQWNETFQFLYDPEETNIMSKSKLSVDRYSWNYSTNFWIV